jgi:hypothetical protein
MDPLGFSSATETTLVLSQANAAAGTAGIDWQYATRRDFEFCVAPIFQVPPDGLVGVGGFNRAQTYWVRAREYFADGSRAAWTEPRGFSTLPGADNYPNYPIQIAPAQIVIPMRPSQWFGTSFPGYPVANLGRPSPMAAMRQRVNAGLFGFQIETDGSDVDTVALLETNFPEGATVRVIAGSTLAKATGQTAPDFVGPFQNFRASENLPGRRGYHSLIRLAAPIRHRFIGLQIGGALPPADIAHITHAVFGKARVIKNYGDMTDQPFDLSTMERMRDGTPDGVAGFRGRRVDFELAAMTEAQHEAGFADLAQRVGLSEPVFIMPNSKAGAYLHDRLLYGNLTANRQTNSNARFTRSLSIESVIN